MAPPDDPVWTALTPDPLDAGAVHDFLLDERAGGTCVFVGTTRRWTGDVRTDVIAYEAYAEMASAELAELADQAVRRWGVFRVALLHRLGDVAPREASVVVGAACAHRAEAFEAARWLIDTLKDRVPIWKTEHADG